MYEFADMLKKVFHDHAELSDIFAIDIDAWKSMVDHEQLVVYPTAVLNEIADHIRRDLGYTPFYYGDGDIDMDGFYIFKFDAPVFDKLKFYVESPSSAPDYGVLYEIDIRSVVTRKAIHDLMEENWQRLHDGFGSLNDIWEG